VRKALELLPESDRMLQRRIAADKLRDAKTTVAHKID